MNAEEQRLAIATIRGETVPNHRFHSEDDGRYYECGLCGETYHWNKEEPKGPCPGTKNNYPFDLNAISEIEMNLNENKNLLEEKDGFMSERDLYIEELENIISKTCAEDDIYFYCLTANASQRLEAILKVKEYKKS